MTVEDIIGKGRTGDVFRYSENKVIKVFHKEFTFLADEEYATAIIIGSADVHAPHVYEMIDVDDKKGIIYEYISGTSMLHMMQKNPLKVWSYARLLADLQTEIHNKPVTGSGLSSVKKSLAEAIHSVLSLNQEEKAYILDYLDGLPNNNRLCHYDFHPGNILMFDNGAKVIDWMTASVGDPCADVCRTSVILRSNILPPNTSALEAVAIKVFRKIFYRNYISRYLRATGTTLQKVEQWLLPVAAARLLEGIESEKLYLNEIIQLKLSEQGAQ